MIVNNKELTEIKMDKPVTYANQDGVKIELFPLLIKLREEDYVYTFEGKVVLTNCIKKSEEVNRTPYIFSFLDEKGELNGCKNCKS